MTTRRLYFAALDSVFARLNAAGNAVWYLTDRLGSVRFPPYAANAILRDLATRAGNEPVASMDY